MHSHLGLEKVKNLKIETVINQETGEVIKEESTYQVPAEPNYVKLYLDCLGVFFKNKGLDTTLNDMLLATLKRMTYADQNQLLIINSFVKDEICKECGKSRNRLDQAITLWVKEGILKRVARGTYKVNPFLFGKGDWRNIRELRATFNFADGIIDMNLGYDEKGGNTND